MAGETEILKALLSAPARPLPAGVVGPGDDAAVLPWTGGGSLVVSCDALEEGVHFRRDWMSVEDLAHKLVAVTLSDLAAMGAEPVALLVAVAWPAASRAAEAAEFARALHEACAQWGCPVLGGDTDVRPGTLRLEGTALGRADSPVLRSTARAGDALFVTGPLGGAALAVEAWLALSPLDPCDADSADALRRFRRPLPRLDASRALRERATALIDLSDGLLTDAGHLARASGLSARLTDAAVPGHAAVPERRRHALVLEGGEDYELLVAGEAALAEAWPGLTRVGELVAGPAGHVELV